MEKRTLAGIFPTKQQIAAKQLCFPPPSFLTYSHFCFFEDNRTVKQFSVTIETGHHKHKLHTDRAEERQDPWSESSIHTELHREV